ncbi:MAG TPA: hypothetical protein VE153_19365 [Myxococcus sp.]|jgi:hypothetical protein|nr:hypothetical protein [Myxococcus sp.]
MALSPRAQRTALLLLATSSAVQVACATPSAVTGSIPPSAFQFSSVVPLNGKKQGGWKAAQVTILLGRLSSVAPEATWCDIEVGVPEANRKGPVTDAYARVESSVAATSAAREVLIEPLPTAILCDSFRGAMKRALDVPIPGCRVTGFLTAGLPRTRYPEETP